MSVYPVLESSEFLLTGKWVTKGGSVVADDTSRRIEFLISDVLVQVATDDSGWVVLYKDPGDGRYWELSYPDSGEHGGGAPLLRCLGVEEVKQRYGIILSSLRMRTEILCCMRIRVGWMRLRCWIILVEGGMATWGLWLAIKTWDITFLRKDQLWRGSLLAARCSSLCRVKPRRVRPFIGATRHPSR